MPRFHITLDSELGPREGFLLLQETGAGLTGTLSLLGAENPVTGGRTEGGQVCLTHHLRTAVSDLLCRTVLELGQESLSGTVSTPMGQMPLRGNRLE